MKNLSKTLKLVSLTVEKLCFSCDNILLVYDIIIKYICTALHTKSRHTWIRMDVQHQASRQSENNKEVASLSIATHCLRDRSLQSINKSQWLKYYIMQRDPGLSPVGHEQRRFFFKLLHGSVFIILDRAESTSKVPERRFHGTNV